MRVKQGFRWMILAVVVTSLIGLTAPLAEAQSGVCDNAPVSRLEIGNWAAVSDVVLTTSTGALRMRSEPRTTGEEVTLLPAGSVMRIVDGPACNDGFVWWYVAVHGSAQEGWVAEGHSTNYYLNLTNQPPEAVVATLPPPTAADQAAQPTASIVTGGGTSSGRSCPDDPAESYISVGAAARVADQTRPARLRSEASVDSFINQVVYQDAALTILDGPVCADEYTWWLVDGGWVIEAANGRYTILDPANPPPTVDFAGGLSPIPPSPVAPPPETTLIPTVRPTTPPLVAKRAQFTADGLTLIVGDGDGVRLYETGGYTRQTAITTGPVLDFVTVNDVIYAVVWAPEGIRLVNALTGDVWIVLTNAPHDPAWATASPSGSMLILGPTSDGTTATLWDLNTAQPAVNAPYWWPGWGVVNAAFDANGVYVMLNDIFYRTDCQSAGSGCQFDIIRNDFMAAGVFGATNTSGDGSLMIGFSERLWLWDGNAMGLGFTLRSTLSPQIPQAVALSGDGSFGAIASRRLLELWNLTPGVYSTIKIIELPESVSTLDYRSGSTQLVIAAGNSVLIYDASTGNLAAQAE